MEGDGDAAAVRVLVTLMPSASTPTFFRKRNGSTCGSAIPVETRRFARCLKARAPLPTATTT
jgi:hypothetical protein